MSTVEWYETLPARRREDGLFRLYRATARVSIEWDIE
jgi:hypothetical protein